MNPQKLKIAVAQMTSTDQLDENLKKVAALFAEGSSLGADLVIFPENTLFFRVRSGSKVQGLEWGGPELARLQSLVEKSATALMLTTPLSDGAGKLKNSTLLFEAGRAPQLLYSKIHLFDVDVEGAPAVRESEVFAHGESPRVLDFRGWKIGLSICYDLRFAELYLNYAQAVDLILVPSAFLVPTGEAHWHTLLRARAIEAQAYVAAPAQVGEHVSGDQIRCTYGHSLVVDPWGRVLADLKTGLGVATLELSREAIEKARRQIPMKSHRRLGQV